MYENVRGIEVLGISQIFGVTALPFAGGEVSLPRRVD